MRFSLSPEAEAAGYGLAAYETIGSTSTEAMARLKAGEAAPLWVVSRHQSEGRGRRGRAWQSPPDNLAASLALRLDLQPATIATLGFVAGVALVRALEAIARDGRDLAKARFRLKWPNDILADGAKLAGILLETEEIGQRRAVIVGIGVNVAHAPSGLPYPAACLASLGHDVGAEELFRALSAEWPAALAIWDDGRGFPAIREMWLAHAVGLSGPVTVRAAASRLSGRFEAIDERGQLLLRLADGALRSVSAGEVFFGEAAIGDREEAA